MAGFYKEPEFIHSLLRDPLKFPPEFTGWLDNRDSRNVPPAASSEVPPVPACIAIAQHTTTFQPAPGITASDEFNDIGTYRAWYDLGYRLQVKYAGEYKRDGLSADIWLNGVHQAYYAIPHPSSATVITIDTGWFTVAHDPLTANAALPWQIYLAVDNGSILSDGQIGAGTWCFQYVLSTDLVTPLRHIVTKTANYTVTAEDEVVLMDATGGAKTITLITGPAPGQYYTFKKIDASANAVTVDTPGTETIDGSATFVLANQYDTVTIVSDGAQWWVVRQA